MDSRNRQARVLGEMGVDKSPHSCVRGKEVYRCCPQGLGADGESHLADIGDTFLLLPYRPEGTIHIQPRLCHRESRLAETPANPPSWQAW